jgi:hypothetical protein
MSFKIKFSNLGHPKRIWAISAIHGQIDKLTAVHEKIFDQIIPGDRLVYTGNYLAGPNAKPIETLNALLDFRRDLMARPGIMAEDFVYLRGIQEELWRTLLQAQMTINAGKTIEWISTKHPEMDGMLRAYGSSLDEASRVAREGVMNITRWSLSLQNSLRQQPGHEKFFTVLRRAAFTENPHMNDNNILFVHAGIDTKKPLVEQEDQFWWAHKNFNTIEMPVQPFRAVIRGYDPEQGGVHIGKYSLSLDGGCGHGGKLICARLSDIGDVQELIAA